MKKDNQDQEIDFSQLDCIKTKEQVVWLMEHSPSFKYSIMGFAVEFFGNNKKMILENLKK